MVDVIEIIQEGYMYFYNQISPLIGETYLQLFVFTIGLFIYAVFIWKFYKSLSRRDIFELNLEKYNLPTVKHKTFKKIGSSIAYIFKYGFVLPFYIFFWFLILSVFLLILSEELTVTHIILTSVIIVSTTRVTSYYKEELSTDLAKLIPFALMAILIINPNFFSMEITVTRLSKLPTLGSQIIKFLIFSIVLEWILRILYLIKVGISKLKS